MAATKKTSPMEVFEHIQLLEKEFAMDAESAKQFHERMGHRFKEKMVREFKKDLQIAMLAQRLIDQPETVFDSLAALVHNRIGVAMGKNKKGDEASMVESEAFVASGYFKAMVEFIVKSMERRDRGAASFMYLQVDREGHWGMET